MVNRDYVRVIIECNGLDWLIPGLFREYWERPRQRKIPLLEVAGLPHYTRPEVLEGMESSASVTVRPCLRRWRWKQSLGRTLARRPEPGKAWL